MKRPDGTVSSILLVFLACAYVGYYATIRIAYRHAQSQWFNTLPPEQARLLAAESPVLWEAATSRMLSQATPESLQANVEHLSSLRVTAPRQLWPILDLYTALDHATIAQLAQRANQAAEADRHRQAAKDLLRSLGWRDVSDAALDRLAEQKLKWAVERRREN